MSSLPACLSCVLPAVLAVPGLGRDEGWLGVALDPEREPPVLVEVFPDSPAERAGLLPGDRVLAVDGERVSSVADLARVLSGRVAGAEVRLDVLRRGGHTESVAVRLARRPSLAARPHTSTPPRLAHGRRSGRSSPAIDTL